RLPPQPARYHAGHPAAAHFAGQARSAAGAVLGPTGQAAVGIAGGRSPREAGNGSSGSAAPVADRHGGSDPLGTRAGMLAAEPARERRRDPIGPNHRGAVPNHDPSARPSEAVLPDPSRENTKAAVGSSEPGLATQTTARTRGPPCPMDRRTRSSSTNYPARKPSSGRRRKSSSSRAAGRSRRGSPEPRQDRGRATG